MLARTGILSAQAAAPAATVSTFFVVTVSGSLYRIDADGGRDDPAIARSAENGAWEAIDTAGVKRFDIMGSGGIVCRRPHQRRRGGTAGDCLHTTGIAAMFLDEILARICKAWGEHASCDERWLAATRQVYALLRTDQSGKLFVPSESAFFPSVIVNEAAFVDYLYV